MEKRGQKIRSSLKHLTKTVPQKKYKIVDIFQDFKQRYGKRPAIEAIKERKHMYLKWSPKLQMNSTQLSYQKDITQIKYNAEIKAGDSSVVNEKWPVMPSRPEINWKLLESLENMVQNWNN